jgi:hypothetical protein
MRYNITITGELDTWANEDQIRADAPMVLAELGRVHPGVVAGTAQLVSVERLPDPTPVAVTADVQDQIDQLSAILDELRSKVSRQA